ncbi:MAG: acetate/propionate family kinase [Gammaproteobacteria bacterium]
MLLTVNAGSSSLKLSAWREGSCLWRVTIDLAHGTAPHWQTTGKVATPPLAEPGSSAATHLRTVLASLQADTPLAAVAHRVVHGGDIAETARLLEPPLLADLRALAPRMPLHQPATLSLIDSTGTDFPALRQVACFDTAFHARQPELARRYALPESFYDEGIKACGFHGLSYDSVCRQLFAREPALRQARLLLAHLGNGASACAVNAGRSVATTMGFSALDGLVMGTRCGRIDPGVLLYLLQAKGYDAAALEDLLYRHAGLLGVSGTSADMRVLLQQDNEHARRAVDLFCYRAAQEMAGLLPALGGVDAIVFTGGIGENQPAIRARITGNLAFLGAHGNAEANDDNRYEISTGKSAVRVLVCPCDEESVMASEACRLLALAPG